MKCEEALRRMEEYHDGELDSRTAAALEAHLKECPSCARAREGLNAESGIYEAYRQNLERELQVPTAMWPRVQAQAALARTQLSARLLRPLSLLLPNSPLARQAIFAALLVIVSIAGTLTAVKLFETGQEVSRSRPVSPIGGLAGMLERRFGSPAENRSLESAMRSIRRAEQDYIEAIRLLSDIVDKRKPTLDPWLVAELEKNLKAIDESIAATRQAYLAHPSDPELALYMLAAYSKKVELLQELAS